MNTAALSMSRDDLRPRTRDGLGIGALLALLVHVLLIAALAFGVNWRAHEPEGVIAELWSAVPQVAAPRAVSPRPAPPPPPAPVEKTPAPVPRAAPVAPPVADAQIAIEKARREEAKREADEREAQRQQRQQREAKEAEQRQQREAKEEAQRQKAERDKERADEARREEAKREQLAQEAADRKKKELAEKARKDEAALVAQREAYLKRIQGQAGATGDAGSTGTAARSSGPSAGYAGRIKARIKPNIVFADSVSGNPVATVEVRCAPDGTIVSRKLQKSSGSSTWDDSVLRAIDKTAVLPRDTDGSVPPVMQIEFKPRD
mgnify:FL=1